ncbi:MAG: AbgT family transporter [Bacteroidota bacterium]
MPDRRSPSADTSDASAWRDRILERVERVGNALPDPVTLFVIFIGMVMLSSVIVSWAGVAVTHPGTGETITANNLFSRENIQRLFVEMPETFALFPPLGMVLLVMLGIGVADKSGLISAALSSFVSSVPRSLLTAAVIFAGIMSSLAVDAGYVVVIPLGAVLFYGVGRHPLAGLAAAFAGVSAGFSANLLLTSLDPLLAGFTTPAAQMIDPAYEVPVTANYYLMIVLTPVFMFVGWAITEFVVEPYLGKFSPAEDLEIEKQQELTAQEGKGLRVAGLVVLVTLIGIAFLVVPQNAPLRGAAGDLGPFYSSIVALMFVAFLLPGIAFGIVTGTIKSDRDVAKMAASSMSDLGIYIVLAFAAAHFIALFNWSNLGSIVAISGADVLQRIGFTGVPLIVAFVVVSSVINMFVGSASAKWAIMAPIFVPMLMLLGYSPETTQAAYRVGDSFTNVLTPLLPYFPLVIVFAQRYDRTAGIGSIISVMLPYSIAFGIASILVLVIWILIGLPLGPGAPLEYVVPGR